MMQSAQHRIEGQSPEWQWRLKHVCFATNEVKCNMLSTTAGIRTQVGRSHARQGEGGKGGGEAAGSPHCGRQLNKNYMQHL